MFLILYLLTIALAFFNWFIFLFYSKFRTRYKNKLLLTIVSWIYAGYMVTIFWQPLFIEKRLAGNISDYDGWIGFFIYVLVFVLSFCLNRKKLRNEFKQWNELYGSAKK